MKPTALIYSSHDRSEYLHRFWIVERALQSYDNKTLLHLPFSQRNRRGQEYDYNNFRWYYDRFAQWGLEYCPFYWSDNLSREDVDTFFRMLWHSQVVLLGGGSSSLGLARYKAMGEMYYGDRDLFGRILHERQQRGLLTVGFSAGADQLCQYLCEIGSRHMSDPYGFGLARNVITTLHHEPGREDEIWHLASNMPHCMVFGLPNDSGIATHQFTLWSGNTFQIIWFVTDSSWDVPNHQHHIKTRHGVKIEHIYNDGRHWSFNGGDILVRIISPDGRWQDGTIITNDGRYIDYWSQGPSGNFSIEQIINDN